MAEIVNLNHFRKTKKKTEKTAQAASNRERHGRRKSDRQRQELEESRRKRELTGHVLENTASDGESDSRKY